MTFKFIFNHFIKPPLIIISIAILFALGLAAYNKSYASEVDSVRLTVPYSFLYKDRPAWDALESFILSSHYKKIVLVWKGMGGHTDMGWKFIHTIQQANRQGKEIIFEVIGVSWSEHANVVCFAPIVKVYPGAELNFHASYDETEHHYTNDYEGVQEEYRYFNQCISRGYLTSYTRDAIIKEHKAVRYQDGHLTIFNDIDRR